MHDDETKSIPELRGERPATRAPWNAEEGLRPGTKVGRFLVLYRLGRGGMGEVYAAYDPELDRKVAVKFLRHEIDSRQARELQRREAKAMAQLRHRNVVAVYDVGEHRERTFIAMELVDGQTLRDWLSGGDRRWRQVLEVFLRAGRGLEAAHAADIVHRDFKPSNVMVTGDLQARVMDFGLAGVEAIADRGQEHDRSSRTPGTPAYLAPERADGAPGDARSDQFSFCVALYRALYGEPPYVPPVGARRQVAAGTDESTGTVAASHPTRHEVSPAAAGTPAIRPPVAGRGVPGWLRKALLRGLDLEPEERFATMDGLLTALDPGRRRARELRLLAVVGLILGALTVAWVASRSRTPPPCGDASPRLAGIWDAGRKQAIRTAFAGADNRLGEDTFGRIEGTLDDYTRNWLAMHREACEATRVRGEQSERMLDLRMVCLDGRLAELGALTRIFAAASSEILFEAVSSAQELSSLRRCADRAALDGLMLPPADPRARAEIERMRAVTEEQAVRLRTHQPVDDGALEQSIEAARRHGYAPLESRTLYIRAGYQTHEIEDPGAALESYHAALVAAIAGGDHPQQLRVYSQLVFLTGYIQRDVEAARGWQQLAEAALTSLGPGHDEDEYVAETSIAMLAWANGDFEEAYRRRQRALELGERLWGADDPQVGKPLTDLATMVMELGRTGEAATLLERAAALNEQGYGPNHPILARTLHNLASLHADAGDYVKALSEVRRVVAILEGANSRHRNLTFPLLLEGELLVKLDRPEDARLVAERCAALAREGFGEEHPLVAPAFANLGEVALLQGRPDEAHDYFILARKVCETLPPDHRDHIHSLLEIGRAELDRGRPAAARELLEKALPLAASAVLAEHDQRTLQIALGRAYLELGEPARAQPVLESAFEIGRPEVDPALAAEARFALARSLGTGEAARAVELARQALDGLPAGGSPRTRSLRAEVEAWLKACCS